MFRNIITLLVFASLISIQSANAQSNPSIEFIGSTGGKVTDFAIYEDPDTNKIYCYIAQGAAIIIFDVTDYTNPIEINRLFPSSTGFKNFSLSENKFVIARSSSHPIYSVINPNSPQLLGTVSVRGSKVHLSGHKLQTQYEPEVFGSRRCFFGSSIYDITDINNPVEISNVEFCNASSHLRIPFLLHTADSTYNDPNFYWMIFHGLAGSIWFNANQYEVPVIQNDKYFPDYLPAWNGWNGEPSPYGAVVYQNWLHLTFKDHILTYDPRIQDRKQNFVITPISNVNDAPLLDDNLMYVPTNSEYFIYDLSIPNNPIFLQTTSLPIFIPRYIENGIAFGMKNDMVIMQSITPFIDDVYQLVPNKLIDLDKLEKYEVVFPIHEHTNSHPEMYRDRELDLTFQNYSILLSNTYDRFFNRDSGRFLYIHDKNFDQSNPEYIEAYSVSANVGPQGRIEGNILILYNNDETYYFRLGGDLFSTSISNWQLH